MLRDIATRVVGKRTWPFHRHARVVAVPILLITALAIAIVVITLLWASHRTNEVALSHERQLVRNALTEKSAQMLRELVSLANSDSAVRNIWIKFDPNWIDARIGLRLSKVFGHDYIFVADGKDRLIYALAGQTRLDPDRFSNESVIFQSILDALRSRPPQLDEPRPDDRSSPQAQIRRQTTVHLTSLLGRPAVMGAAVIVSS